MQKKARKEKIGATNRKHKIKYNPDTPVEPSNGN